MNDHPSGATNSDQPLKPLDSTVEWWECDPKAIVNDPELATLITQIGIASSALDVQIDAASEANRRHHARWMRDGLFAIVNSAAVSNEAIKTIQGGLARLRPLAIAGGASEDLLLRIGQLCGGKHPASPFLERARNQLGFHWDADVIRPAVEALGNNQRLVWLEFDADGEIVHRFALEVMTQALLPELAGHLSAATALPVIERALDNMHDAMTMLINFCAASTIGFLNEVGGRPRRR